MGLAVVCCAGPRGDGDAGVADATRDVAMRDVSSSDGGSGDGSGSDADRVSLLARADAVMVPAFSATPASLGQCVGGVAVIVTPTEELVRGWGATTLGGSSTPDASTLFQIGSLTKVFTGLAMAREVERGAFGVDTSAGELLAADLRGATSRWATMGALITHHAGLPAFPGNLVDRDGDGMRDPGIDPRSPAAGYSRVDLRAALASWTAPASAPYLYSNVGTGLAGLALQDHLGLASHHEVLRRTVADDLRMTETWGEVAAIPASVRPRLATGHAVQGAARVAGIPGEMGVLASAGEIVTTGEDMRRFLRALVGLDTTPLAGAITRATTRLADGPDGRGMGYAIEIEDRGGTTRYRKGGNTSSYAAYLLWSARPQIGVAVLTNCGSFMPVVGLAEALHDAAR